MVISIVPVSALPPAAQMALLAAYVLIAGLVTAHVLLRKRDVRAALGWIGVAWLSPLLGGFLYYVFGINRVTRRALRFEKIENENGKTESSVSPDVSAPIAALARIGERVTGAALAAGNDVAVLHGGREAYPAMLEAIRGAQRNVALASYIFRDDETGRAFGDALIEAHGRGVAVRVLLDSIGSGYIYSGILRRLRQGGVPAARFLHTWVPWRMPFLNMRNHKKLLIADGAVGFAGGLNIGAENTAKRGQKSFVDDVHVRVEGPAVRQLMDTFAQDWAFTTGEDLDAAIWWPALTAKGPVCARGIRSGPDADLYKIEAILGAALEQARRRVRIVTPYFLPDTRLLFAIAQARLRGIAVDIVIPARSDYFFLDWAMRAHLRFFQGAPETIWFSPPPFDHAKLMTVDGEWCLIGSSNWDTRSFRLNFEFDLECYDRALTADIDARIDEKIAQSETLDREKLMGAPRWMQLRDAAVRLMLPYL